MTIVRSSTLGKNLCSATKELHADVIASAKSLPHGYSGTPRIWFQVREAKSCFVTVFSVPASNLYGLVGFFVLGNVTTTSLCSNRELRKVSFHKPRKREA